MGIETGGGVGPGLKPDLWEGFSGGGSPCYSGRTGKGKGKGRSRFPEGMSSEERQEQEQRQMQEILRKRTRMSRCMGRVR